MSHDSDPLFDSLNAAVFTLRRLGYTYEGGDEWTPPLEHCAETLKKLKNDGNSIPSEKKETTV